MKINTVDISKIVSNFGMLKTAFNTILVEGMVSKNEKNKTLFKKYIKTIKESKVLKTQFLVYNNIENKLEENEFKATQFLQENIALLKQFSKKEILEANTKLVTPILYETVDAEAGYANKALHENITKLIFTDKTAGNIDSIVEATASIVDYIKNNKKVLQTEAIELPSSMLTSMMVDKYNEKYSQLSESDKSILRVLIESTDNEKKDVYAKTLRECIDLIDTKLGGTDLDVKDKLLRVKDKLLNDKQEINEDFEKNISKLVDLKDSLIG